MADWVKCEHKNTPGSAVYINLEQVVAILATPGKCKIWSPGSDEPWEVSQSISEILGNNKVRDA